MAANLPFSNEEFCLLLEAGFIAVNQMDETSAKQIFEACEAMQPEHNLPKVGMGYIHLCKMELQKATKVFEGILAKDPENEMAKTFLGMIFSFQPSELAKGEKLLTDSATHAADPAVKKLAADTLDFVDTHLKRPISPAELHKATRKKKTQ